MTTLHIKNMVCDRCISTARRLLLEEGYTVSEVTLGKATVQEEAHEINMPRIQWQLRDLGFDLIYDRDEQMVALIKASVLAYINTLMTGTQHRKLSVFLSEALETGYQTLSRTFSEREDDTIEQYYIRLKIEKVKEWLSYEELTLSEIAWKLDYSSVQHLSGQFKKITGMTVREWKARQHPDRQPLDEV